MRRLWLLFAQTATVCLAMWFVVVTLKPEWVSEVVDRSRKVQVAPVNVPMLEAPSSSHPDAAGSYRNAAKRAMPSVVNIFTTKEAKRTKNPMMEDPFFRRFFGDQQREQEEKQFSLGSGVIVSSQGYILTNNHVVEAADEIEVALADGRKVVAKVVGADPETDLAVIKIDLPDLPAITLGHAETASVGDVVLAIGNPFGVGQTVTMGIISALGRNHLGINLFENFIQTDAAINPGNSGGALIDTNGNLLGVNTAIYSRSGGSLGIGFAIPVTTVKNVMESIISNGQVVRGYIGVEPQDITPELAESFGLSTKSGAIIAGVVRGGPADRAGMRPGDILVRVQDKPVTDTTEMLTLIAQLQPGAKAKITVMRKSQQAVLDVTVGKRPPTKRSELPANPYDETE
ncbi:MAG: Do family serine endopeptidase [Burkholderiaceae bacterium]